MTGGSWTGSRLIVPVPDRKLWPTLGFEVIDWIEAMLVHGPGDILGEPVVLTDEQRLYWLKMYEVYPRGHEFAGRRRFKRVVKSRRKGTAKTEDAAFTAIAEMDPGCPVRFDGWRREGRTTWVPVGRPVHDPYIPMVAVTEGQVEELAYGAVKTILQHNRCPLVNEYDAGEENVTHITAPGKIEALSSAPSAKEGARTTHQHIDETHKLESPRHRSMHSTMLMQVAKRAASDAWTHETTTMFEEGKSSVAEATYNYALAVLEGRIKDADLYFDHLQASEDWDIFDPKQLRAAIREASGDAFAWADVKAILGQFADPQIGESAARRYWLNQARPGEDTWIEPKIWKADARPDLSVPKRNRIVVGFRGSYDNTEASVFGCTAAGHVFLIGVWEPDNDEDLDYEVPRSDVQATIEEAFGHWRVKRFAFDPLGWYDEGEKWAEAYGERVAVRFETRKTASWAAACSRFFTAATEGDLTHDGAKELERHLANASAKDYGEHRYITAGGKVVSAAFAAVIAYEQSGVLRKKGAKLRTY